jgi:hypothetical protein
VLSHFKAIRAFFLSPDFIKTAFLTIQFEPGRVFRRGVPRPGPVALLSLVACPLLASRRDFALCPGMLYRCTLTVHTTFTVTMTPPYWLLGKKKKKKKKIT